MTSFRTDASRAAEQFLRAYTVQGPTAHQARSADHDRTAAGVQLTRGAMDAFARLDEAAAAEVLARIDGGSRQALEDALRPLHTPAASQERPTADPASERRAAGFAQRAPSRVDPREARAALRDFSRARSETDAIRLVRADPARLATLDPEERNELRAELLGVLLADTRTGKPASPEAEAAALALLQQVPEAETRHELLSTALAGGDGAQILGEVRHDELRQLVQAALGDEGVLGLPGFAEGWPGGIPRMSHAEIMEFLRRLAAEHDGGSAQSNPPAASGAPAGGTGSTRTAPPRIQVDWTWITGKEGFRLNGYVPVQGGAVLGVSGVTVATGVDLGQWNAEQLRRLGVSEELIKKLEPYLGLRKDEAVRYLAEHPLELTPQEARQLDDTMRAFFEKDVANRYNAALNALKASGDPRYANLVPFEELPPEIQTAMVSLAYQYGLGRKGRIKTSGLWDALVCQDWDRAATLIASKDFDTRFASRQAATAELVRQGGRSQGPAHA